MENLIFCVLVSNFTKNLIIDAWHGPKYAPDSDVLQNVDILVSLNFCTIALVIINRGVFRAMSNIGLFWSWLPEAYYKLCQTTKMETLNFFMTEVPTI